MGALIESAMGLNARMGARRLLLIALTLLSHLPPWAQAEVPAVLTLTLDRNTSLRAIAERHLHDADAWPQILRASGLSSVQQLRPGMELRIPIAASRRLARALAELHRLIYRATEAGALIFADALIEDAMAHQAAASTARREAGLAEANRLAEQGIRAATEALRQSLEQRDVPAEAILGNAGGRVERRRPGDPDWARIRVDTLLAEAERLRTLAESFAVVRFRDATRVRMGEYSQMAIRRLRADRLTRREEVDVVLYAGDLRALMGAEASRQVLAVAPEGVETRVDSRHYWVQKTPERSRLANFDGEIAVTAQGATVHVRRNQGTLVEPGAAPREPVDLLPAPQLLAPADGEQLLAIRANLRWSAVPSAAAYWLEVARDPEMTELVLSDTAVGATDLGLDLGADGVYYWRVSAVDASGLPGPAAPVRHFRKTLDETPPFLQLSRPPAGRHVDDPDLLIEGRTELGTHLSVNGVRVQLGRNGAFRHRLRLTPGVNRLALEVRDPAGNVQRIERVVHLTPEDALPLSLAPDLPRDPDGRVLVNRPWLTLTGEAPVGTVLRVVKADASGFAAAGTADENGQFGLTIRVDEPVTRLDLTAVGPAGRQRRETIDLVLDRTPPVIHLDPEPPRRSARSTLRLRGWVEGGDQLYLGDREAQLNADGRFALETGLRPGSNRIELVARDAAGNNALWQLSIVLDQEPPQLADYRVIAAEQVGRPVVVVEIEAEDASGLVASVPYRVRVGDWVGEGFAQRCANRRCHRDRLRLPVDGAAGARLVSVTLQDYLGNRREVQLD